MKFNWKNNNIDPARRNERVKLEILNYTLVSKTDSWRNCYELTCIVCMENSHFDDMNLPAEDPQCLQQELHP